MPRYSKTLTPAAQAAFVADLAGGGLVEAAAGRVGVAISTLYWRRRRDPGFAAAWEAAVAASTRPVLLPPRRGRFLRFGKTRRTRFCARRRALFLGHLEKSCNTTDAAEAAGVHVTTVHRRIARDPDFAAASAAALARGYAFLDGELVRQRAAATARPHRLEPTGRPTADFDEAMKLLARWTRPDGSIGRRFVRHGRRKRWTFEEAIMALDRQLRWLGIPILGEAPETPTPSTGVPAG
jgi:hypothetical protein